MTATRLPNLIIAGVIKGGTTSIFTYLSRHPEICASKIKETNYFMPMRYSNNLPPLSTYHDYFRHCDPSVQYFMESSPRYIYGGNRVALAVKNHLYPLKIMILLRDPVERLFSFYRHMKNDTVVPKEVSFEAFSSQAVKDYLALKNQGAIDQIDVYEENVYVRGLVQGFYTLHLRLWLESFGDNVKFFFFDDLKNDPGYLMKEICAWLDIAYDIYQNDNFSVENKGINLRNRFIHRWASLINMKFEPFFRSYYPLKQFLRKLYFWINTSNRSEQLGDSSRSMLASVYNPYNQELYNLLTSRGYRRLPPWLNRYT